MTTAMLKDTHTLCALAPLPEMKVGSKVRITTIHGIAEIVISGVASPSMAYAKGFGNQIARVCVGASRSTPIQAEVEVLG